VVQRLSNKGDRRYSGKRSQKNNVTLEEIIVYRDGLAHLVPERVRLALVPDPTARVMTAEAVRVKVLWREQSSRFNVLGTWP